MNAATLTLTLHGPGQWITNLFTCSYVLGAIPQNGQPLSSTGINSGWASVVVGAVMKMAAPALLPLLVQG